MKPAAIMGMLLLMASASRAQFTLTPQVGIDRSNRVLNINNSGNFNPGGQSFLKASLRADYKFKGGHGPFLGIGTNPSPLAYSFTNPSEAKTAFTTSTGNSTWRLEAGYMYTSKAIQLKKSSTKNTGSDVRKTEVKKSCGSYARSHCGSQQKQAVKKPSKSMNLRLQPSAGLAYLPSTPDNIVMNGKEYRYNAGNSNTALVTGLGFEFGSGRERILTVGLHYTKGLRNKDVTLTTPSENGKLVTNTFSSAASAWGITIGVPFTLKKQAQKVKKEQKVSCQERYQYRSRCVKRI